MPGVTFPTTRRFPVHGRYRARRRGDGVTEKVMRWLRRDGSRTFFCCSTGSVHDGVGAVHVRVYYSFSLQRHLPSNHQKIHPIIHMYPVRVHSDLNKARIQWSRYTRL